MKRTVQPPKKLSKIDQNGNFTYFPGISVVAACYPELTDFCEEVYSALAGINLIQEYYSLLPAKSYHMTTMDLNTADEEQRKGKKWVIFVQENLAQFKELEQQFSANSIKPEIDSMTVSSGWVIILSLKLSSEHEEKIKAVAKTLNKEKAVPKVFHVTLAYSLPGKKLPIDIGEGINDMVKDKLTRVISKMKFPMILPEPKLCHFHDMTAFQPWSAETNPFSDTTPDEKPKRSFFNHFFGRKKDNKDHHVVSKTPSYSHKK